LDVFDSSSDFLNNKVIPKTTLYSEKQLLNWDFFMENIEPRKKLIYPETQNKSLEN